MYFLLVRKHVKLFFIQLVNSLCVRQFAFYAATVAFENTVEKEVNACNIYYISLQDIFYIIQEITFFNRVMYKYVLQFFTTDS